MPLSDFYKDGAVDASRARAWVFTRQVADGATVEDAAAVAATFRFTGAAFFAFQLEKAPTTGKLHFQGMVKFHGPVRLKAAKASVGGSPWMAVMRGSPKEAYAYVTKEESRVAGPWSSGELPAGQGARTDLDLLIDAAKRNASDAELVDIHGASFVRYYRGLAAVRRAVAPPRNFLTKTIVFFGPSGAGKTRAANSYDSPDNTFQLPLASSGQSAWFDGYIGQRTVVIDEFFGQLSQAFMCQLCDRYAMRVQLKGDSVWFIAKTVIVTSNLHPYDFWRTGVKAFKRRCGLDVNEKVDMGVVCYLPTAEYPTAESWITSQEYSNYLHRSDPKIAATPFVSALDHDLDLVH